MCNVLNPENFMSSVRLAARYRVFDDDIRGLAGIALWSQKNVTPHNAVKPTNTHNK
jgi:hypothetical protein